MLELMISGTRCPDNVLDSLYHLHFFAGTFKLKKLEKQKEGFNPNTISDKLYFLDKLGKYVNLTPELYQKIEKEQAGL